MENLLIDEEYKKDILKLDSLIEYIVNNYDIQEIIDELEEYLPDDDSDDEIEDINVGVDKDGFYYLK
jgi:RNA binding exosome subunit